MIRAKKIRWAGIAVVLLAPLLITGCASNHSLFGGGQKKTKASAYPMSERTCLMRAMYFESNRSSREGMVAVGTIIMNRVNSTAYPKTICGVVGQPNQFAPGVLTREMTEPASKMRAGEAATAVLGGERDKKSKNAMFFHTAGLKYPYTNMHYVQVAGGNAFYEKRGRDGALQVPVNDSPYDVAFAFAQERSGNAPKFAAQDSEQAVAQSTQQPAVQAPPQPVVQSTVQVAQMATPSREPVVVAQADYVPVPTPVPAHIDQMHTGSVALGYAMPSKAKIDEIGMMLQKQKKVR